VAKIAVEVGLTDIRKALESKGFDVVMLKQESDAQQCDCCVISGIDRNVMGMQNTVIEGPVIDCNGMDTNQICEEVERRLGH